MKFRNWFFNATQWPRVRHSQHAWLVKLNTKVRIHASPGTWTFLKQLELQPEINCTLAELIVLKPKIVERNYFSPLSTLGFFYIAHAQTGEFFFKELRETWDYHERCEIICEAMTGCRGWFWSVGDLIGNDCIFLEVGSVRTSGFRRKIYSLEKWSAVSYPPSFFSRVLTPCIAVLRTDVITYLTTERNWDMTIPREDPDN